MTEPETTDHDDSTVVIIGVVVGAVMILAALAVVAFGLSLAAEKSAVLPFIYTVF